MTSINPSGIVYFFSISVPYNQCEALYSPSVPHVVIMSESGTSVQVPTNNLRRFVTAAGVKGRFRMVVSPNNKIKSFERLR